MTTTEQPDVFFPIVDGSQLEDAVLQTLQDWFLTYTREFEIQRGIPRDYIPQPRSWVVADNGEREGADQLPSIVVVSPGLTGEPLMDGEGNFRAAWIIGVGIFVSARTRSDTSQLSRQYAAIVRAILLQKASLDGSVNVSMMRWMDESYDDNFQFTDEQTISFAQITFNIEVYGVVHRFKGPVGPPDPETQPGMSWEEIHTTEILVEARED